MACIQLLRERGYFEESRKSLKLALGLALQEVSQVLLTPLSTAMAGHLGKEELDAVTLANTIINVFGNAIVMGMATACDTYFSQAFGNKQLPLLGILLQRSLMIHLLLFLFLCPLYLNMEQILLLIGQDPIVSKLTGEYVFFFIPGMVFLFGGTILKKFLVCQNDIISGIVIGYFGLAAQAVFQYLFLYHFNLGVRGSSLGMDAACFVMFVFFIIYIMCSKSIKPSWQGWSWKLFENWWPFTKLGIYGIFMLCLEWWAFEVALILAGLLGTTQLGAQGVFFNIEAVSLPIGGGLGDGTGIRVGQALGKGDPAEALRATKVGYVLTVLITVVLSTLIFVLRYQLPKIFTNVPAVLHLTSVLLPMLSLYIILDNIAFVGRGITRGAGKQALATKLIIVAYYFVGMPLGIPLMFLTSTGVIGIWIGLSAATMISGVSFLVYCLFFLDWRAAADDARNRVHAAAVNTTEDTEDSVNERTGLLNDTEQPSYDSTDRGSLSENPGNPVDLPSSDADVIRVYQSCTRSLAVCRSVVILSALAVLAGEEIKFTFRSGRAGNKSR